MRWLVFRTSPAKPKNFARLNSVRKSSGCAAVFKARMKFPLRLSVDMLRNRVSRAFAGDRGAATILRLSPAAFSAPSQSEIDAESDPQAALMEIPAHLAPPTLAPVLWISGEERLTHTVIGRLAAALNAAGRTGVRY